MEHTLFDWYAAQAALSMTVALAIALAVTVAVLLGARRLFRLGRYARVMWIRRCLREGTRK